MREASHQPTFMGHCWTISHTFYSPIYLVDEGNEVVGSVGDVILLFFFVWCESSSLIGLKTWGVRGVSHLYCIWYNHRVRREIEMSAR